jgi:hypothetical protein
MRALLALLLILCSCRASTGPAATGKGSQIPGKPVETQKPNGITQSPIFSGQTRAPLSITQSPYEVKVVAEGLEHPWALAFLEDGRFLVSERPGRIRIINKEGEVLPPIEGVPEVDAKGQGGGCPKCGQIEETVSTKHYVLSRHWLSFGPSVFPLTHSRTQAFFGTSTARTPFLSVALMCSASIWGGRTKEREKPSTEYSER